MKKTLGNFAAGLLMSLAGCGGSNFAVERVLYSGNLEVEGANVPVRYLEVKPTPFSPPQRVIEAGIESYFEEDRGKGYELHRVLNSHHEQYKNINHESRPWDVIYYACPFTLLIGGPVESLIQSTETIKPYAGYRNDLYWENKHGTIKKGIENGLRK